MHRYVIAIGSNRRGLHGGPTAEVRAAVAAIGSATVSPVIATAAMGPSIRRFANAVALVVTDEPPPVLLARMKRVERAFGRRAGQRWGARVIDLDIVLWSGGTWRSPGLTIPHASFRQRRFVLDPLARLEPAWRDPITRLTMVQLRARLTRPCPLP